jgi:hypothetical protein
MYVEYGNEDSSRRLTPEFQLSKFNFNKHRVCACLEIYFIGLQARNTLIS